MDQNVNAEEWFEMYKKQAEGKLGNYNQITDHIFLGGYTAAESKECLLEEMKVQAILTVASDMDKHFPDLLTYKVIDIVDDAEQDIKQHLLDCIRYIDEIVSQD